jgi:hypothetical protein
VVFLPKSTLDRLVGGMIRRISTVWNLFAIVLASGAFCERPAAADEPSKAQVDRWIAELADDDYQIRKSAAERLVEGGDVAHAALSSVANGIDPETRFAARRLMTLIEDSAFHRRLADFAADVDGRRGVTLPGWTEFGALVGHDAAARELFVDMQREEPQLLQRMFDPSSPNRQLDWEALVGRLLRSRIINQPGQLAIPAGSTATLLFLGSLPDANISDSGAAGLRQLTQIPPLSESLSSRSTDNAIRRLVCACRCWRFSPSANSARRKTSARWNRCWKMQPNACRGSKSTDLGATWRRCRSATWRSQRSCVSPARNRSRTASSTPAPILRCSLTSRRCTSNPTNAAPTPWNNGAPGVSNIRTKRRGPPAANFASGPNVY